MKDLRTYIKKNINEGFKLGKNKVKKEEDNFVDLDLPSGTLWGKYNIGATCGSTAESWYGDYFMWGDTEPATNKKCDWYNYKYCLHDSNFLTKYCHIDKKDYWAGKNKIDNKLVLDEEDDMVNVNMGGDCKMPTKEQCEELINNTTNKWVTNYNDIQGLNGLVLTSNMNDNTIFFPATGYRVSNSICNDNSDIYIWSSTINIKNPANAYIIRGWNNVIKINYDFRSNGFVVRYVTN